MDKRQLVAALVERTGIKLDEDDPAFLLVDLNLLVLESRMSEAAKQLAIATQEFSAVTTRSVDDFVAVANEALSKFMQRTSEMKAMLDEMTPGKNSTPVGNRVPAPPATAVGEKPASAVLLWWVVPLLFAAGLVAGLTLSLLLGK